MALGSEVPDIIGVMSLLIRSSIVGGLGAVVSISNIPRPSSERFPKVSSALATIVYILSDKSLVIGMLHAPLVATIAE